MIISQLSVGSPLTRIVAKIKIRLPSTINTALSIRALKIYSSILRVSIMRLPFQMQQNSPRRHIEHNGNDQQDERRQHDRRVVQRYRHHFSISVGDERGQRIGGIKDRSWEPLQRAAGYHQDRHRFADGAGKAEDHRRHNPRRAF